MLWTRYFAVQGPEGLLIDEGGTLRGIDPVRGLGAGNCQGGDRSAPTKPRPLHWCRRWLFHPLWANVNIANPFLLAMPKPR